MSQTINLQTLKGFRDFLPKEKIIREQIISKIKKSFHDNGFEPIETPTLEYASVLQGKSGQEADKLMYTFKDRGGRDIGLRYDQTVPTARFLSQHQHSLPKFFRRYQIQNVFRAENTQAGRYREFLQCDCDIFGSKSNIADAEIVATFYKTYISLGLNDFTIYINDRSQLVETVAKFAKKNDDIFNIIQIIDKLDKIGDKLVIEELQSKFLSEKSAVELLNNLKDNAPSKNLKEIIEIATDLGVPASGIIFEPYLARGLDYYTGIIFEGKLPELKSGSLGGGGRYDNLIQDLGGPNTPAVGFAIGFDRTVEALKEKNILQISEKPLTVLVTIFNEKTLKHSLSVADKLRDCRIATEVYLEYDKIGKQIKFADSKNIPYVVIIGEDEMLTNTIKVKELETESEKVFSTDEFIKYLSTKLQ
jgi:histidyl-tRNA synthetase